MKKMTMKAYEGSASDRKADKSGAHGKESSSKDMKMDKKAVQTMNLRRGFTNRAQGKKK